jgi:hypothetical protein
VLQAAVNGQADAIVTFDRRDSARPFRCVDPRRNNPEDRDMKSPRSTYPMRLPRSVKAEVERRARTEGISVNQFVATAVAEKLAAMGTAEFFAERRARADFTAFDRLMRRKGGEPPRPDDTIGRGRAGKVPIVCSSFPPIRHSPLFVFTGLDPVIQAAP